MIPKLLRWNLHTYKLNCDGCHMWGRRCWPFPEHLISPRRGFKFTSCHGFAVPILSVPGLFYMDADFGLFAWLSLALWSWLIVMLYWSLIHYNDKFWWSFHQLILSAVSGHRHVCSGIKKTTIFVFDVCNYHDYTFIQHNYFCCLGIFILYH